MKRQLDNLMRERGIDALWITGPAQHNPSMTYFTGLAHVTHADLFIKRNEPPVLFHYPMEREEAMRTGLACRDYNEFPMEKILQEAGGDRAKAFSEKMRRVLQSLHIHGKVLVLGKVEVGPFTALLESLRSSRPEVQFVGDAEPPLLLDVRCAKEPGELDRIRAMGKMSVAILDEVKEFLSSQRLNRGELVDSKGHSVTVGAIKMMVRRILAERGGEMPEGMIFASGRDAGIPHSSGTDTDVLREGVPIVFDFFPQEEGGGYFYDITRTWCLGSVPDEVQRVYEDVLSAYRMSIASARKGTGCRELQCGVCEDFEKRGHPTVLSSPQTYSGYVHSLGHGVGLDIHEQPTLSLAEPEESKLDCGMVFTIEPGLYYPEQGIGIRMEDTCCILENGSVEVMAPTSMDLLIPVRPTRNASQKKAAPRNAAHRAIDGKKKKPAARKKRTA